MYTPRGTPGGAGSAPGGGNPVADSTGAGVHQQQVNNWVIEPDGEVIQQIQPNAQGQVVGGMMNMIDESDASVVSFGSEFQQEVGQEMLDDDLYMDLFPTGGRGIMRPQPAPRFLRGEMMPPPPRQIMRGAVRPDDIENRSRGRAMLQRGDNVLSSTQEGIAERAADFVVRAIVAKVPLVTGAGNETKNVRELPAAIGRALGSEGDLSSLIKEMASNGESAKAIYSRIQPMLGNVRFGIRGQRITRRMTNRPNSSLVFEGGRGREQVHQLAREFLNPTGEGVIVRQLTGAINSGALIGERRERGRSRNKEGNEIRQFPISSTEVESKVARRGGTRGFRGGDPVETKEQDITRTRTRRERGRSRARGDERAGREYNSSSSSARESQSRERSKSGTSVYKSGEYRGRVSTEGSGSEPQYNSSSNENQKIEPVRK